MLSSSQLVDIRRSLVAMSANLSTSIKTRWLRSTGVLVVGTGHFCSACSAWETDDVLPAGRYCWCVARPHARPEDETSLTEFLLIDSRRYKLPRSVESHQRQVEKCAMNKSHPKESSGRATFIDHGIGRSVEAHARKAIGFTTLRIAYRSKMYIIDISQYSSILLPRRCYYKRRRRLGPAAADERNIRADVHHRR